MTAPIFELKQEGIIRLEGYQCTQWMSSLDGGTNPDSNAALFIIRNTNNVESFERVATPTDYTAIPENDLVFFEAKGAGGESALTALAGDVLSIDPPLDYWEQTEYPYIDCTFVVQGVVSLASGTLPVIYPTNTLQLPGYTFTDADIGRWVTLVGGGFGTPVTTQVLSVLGGQAQVDYSVGTTTTGATWSINRIQIQSNLGPGSEPRYFPTLVSNVAWSLVRGGFTLVAIGSQGFTARTDPTALLSRTRRMTTLESTPDAATALFTAVQNSVSILQGQLAAMGTTFLGTQTFNYPPV